jgi:hypothetical protein
MDPMLKLLREFINQTGFAVQTTTFFVFSTPVPKERICCSEYLVYKIQFSTVYCTERTLRYQECTLRNSLRSPEIYSEESIPPGRASIRGLFVKRFTNTVSIWKFLIQPVDSMSKLIINTLIY